MAGTYPPVAPTISGDLVTISRFLNNPTKIARRLRTLLEQRYISGVLLRGRFNVEGGAVQFETGESIFPSNNPRPVAPGAEYPISTIGTGIASIAKTVKWGLDSYIFDETIKRQTMDPVNRGLLKLANGNVKTIDEIKFNDAVKYPKYEILGTDAESKILFVDVSILDCTGREPYRGDVYIEGRLNARIIKRLARNYAG